MELGWEAVSALISSVGVVGGLISLFYLVREVRHTATATEGATVQSLMELEVSVFQFVATNAEVYLKGSNDPASLTPEEVFLYDKLVSAQMSAYYCAYVQFTEGLVDIDMWRAYVANIQDHLKNPGFLQMWRANENVYPKPFIEFINGDRV